MKGPNFNKIAVGFIFLVVTLSAVHVKAADPVTAVTAVAAFKVFDIDLLGLKGAAEKIDQAAQNAIASGDAALARQLRALSTTAKELIAQIEDAFARQSENTLNKLDATIGNNITSLANQIKDIEKKTAADVEKLIYQAQGSVNQILSRIPFMKSEPFVFAAKTLVAPGKQLNEIEIIGYGFSLLDFEAGIRINKKLAPAENVTFADDRAIVKLTPEIISTTQASSNPECYMQERYLVEMACSWSEKRWLGKSERKKDIKALVDSDPLQYEVSIKVAFGSTEAYTNSPIKTLTLKSPEYKAKKSGILPPFSGHSRRFNYEFIVPRHFDITKWNVYLDMAYTDSSLTKIDNEPTRSTDNTITVKGVVRSRKAKGTTAYATILLKLEYREKLKRLETKPPHAVSKIMSNSGRSEFSLPANQGIASITGEIKFRGCSEVLDSFELFSPRSSAREHSRNGLFEVNKQGDQLTLVDLSGRRQ